MVKSGMSLTVKASYSIIKHQAGAINALTVCFRVTFLLTGTSCWHESLS